jgi:hypothetical protein
MTRHRHDTTCTSRYRAIIAPLAVVWCLGAFAAAPLQPRPILFGTVLETLGGDGTGGDGELSGEILTRVETLRRRAGSFRSLLPSEPLPPGPEAWLQEKRAGLERECVALISAAGIEEAAASYARDAVILVEWEGFGSSPLAEAAYAEETLRGHPETPLRPYLTLFLAHRFRCAWELLGDGDHIRERDDAAVRYGVYLEAALHDADPLVRFVAAEIERRATLYDGAPRSPARAPVPAAAPPCPEAALPPPITDPLAWAARCFAADAGPEAAAPETLTELRLDIDGDGAAELLVGSTIARGNAGGTHYVFRDLAGAYRYLGALFLHPQAFVVLPGAGGGRPTMRRYRRLGADEGLLDVVAYDGAAFVVTRSERVRPGGEDRVRLCALFESMCERPAEHAGPEAALEPNRLVLAGEVRAGEAFERPFGPGLVFRLEPTPLGWLITVREDGRDEDLARLTPPFHFVPNPRELEGWHFRNAANTGPNEGDVNAPGETRAFIFSPVVGRTIAGPTAIANPTSEEIEAVRAAGSGTLWIEDYRLDHLEPGQERAGFAWLRFTVALEWAGGAGAP